MTEKFPKARPGEGTQHHNEPGFAHPSEKEFAQILDFYLPELDLYLELTTMKQSLVTQKNRKIKLMHELYPEISIRLLYRMDFHRLLARFGFGPVIESGIEGIDRVLLTECHIAQKVEELGR